MKPSPILFAAALAASSVCPAGAARAGSQDATDISGLVVEAMRLPTLLADAPDVQVIDRRQIEARQAVFATDVLDTVPGLAVSDNGGFGGVASVRMRGASSDKTLVVIDGVPQNDPSDPNGAYDFSSLDLSDIQRIEILSGPQSAVWGSDAIGGVISLTTAELDGWRASAEGGSLESFDGSAAAGRRTDAWAFGASIFGDRSDGVAKADGIGPRNPFWSFSAGGYGRYTPSDTLSLDVRLRYDQSYAAVDGYDATTFAFGYTPQYATAHGLSGSAKATFAAPLGFTGVASAGVYQFDHADTYVGHPEDSSAYWALTQDYRVTATRGDAGDPFGVAFGAERETTDATLSTGARQGLGTTSGFLIVRFRPLPPLTLTGSERYDAPDTYPAASSARLAAVLTLPRGFALEGAWGQGFKTPTISEIACDFCTPSGPSVGLRPEHAVGWDATLAWASADGKLSGRLTGYRLAVRDQIQFSPSFPFRYFNLDRTRTVGLEAQGGAQLTPALRLDAEYAYTDAVDLAAHTPMLRVPRHAGSVTLTWSRGPWSGAFTVRAEGPDADINPFTFSPATRPGFVIANLAGSYRINPHLSITARIQDIGDRRYEEALGYGEPRRMVFIGLRAKG